ncbi:uncharacterized protein V6R79_020845 [Siganus canaliculatus]
MEALLGNKRQRLRCSQSVHSVQVNLLRRRARRPAACTAASGVHSGVHGGVHGGVTATHIPEYPAAKANTAPAALQECPARPGPARPGTARPHGLSQHLILLSYDPDLSHDELQLDLLQQPEVCRRTRRTRRSWALFWSGIRCVHVTVATPGPAAFVARLRSEEAGSLFQTRLRSGMMLLLVSGWWKPETTSNHFRPLQTSHEAGARNLRSDVTGL